jgi:predicted ester cyclase
MKKLLISTLCFVAAIQFSFAQSNAERNKAIYRELNKAANEQNLAAYGKFYAESFEMKGIGKGPEAAIANAKRHLATFPDLQINILEIIAEGDLVMARCEATGTQKGEMMGIAPTGKVGKVAHWTINRFNAEGKIIEIWTLNDNLSIMRQLGAIK